MNSNDIFHQVVSVQLKTNKINSDEISKKLIALGADYINDTYIFYRKERGPLWQSNAILYLTVSNDNENNDVKTYSKILELKYPLATLGPEYIYIFVTLVNLISYTFGTKPTLNGLEVLDSDIIDHCDALLMDIKETWGEEAGSESLKIMIETFHYF